MSFDYGPYIREHMFPHIWCPGCGHGILLKGLIRALHKVGADPNRTVVVSGIGCASRLPGYVNFDTLHTTHGRALAFATGIKLANPELNVVVVAGDGDASAIGGNHFIHACRRNIDMTMVVFNNQIYGMTGGQFSPTTPSGDISTTTPLGNPDPPFDISALAIGSGASFVARTTSYHAAQIESYIAAGLEHSGFSVVEVMDSCYTTHGRRNKDKYQTNLQMLKLQKEAAVPIAKAAKMSPEELAGKITTGILHHAPRAEYCDLYRQILLKAQQAPGKRMEHHPPQRRTYTERPISTLEGAEGTDGAPVTWEQPEKENG